MEAHKTYPITLLHSMPLDIIPWSIFLSRMYISGFFPVFPIALHSFEFLYISKLEFTYITLKCGILN